MADVRAFAVFLRVYWKPCPCSLLNNWAELLWSKHFESRRSPPPVDISTPRPGHRFPFYDRDLPGRVPGRCIPDLV